MGKVHIPELAVDEFAWVKIETNQPTAITGHLFVELTEFRFALFQIAPIIVWPELRAFFGIEDVEQAAVIERLAVEPHVLRLIEIQAHAPTGKRRESLRGPRTARLSVTARLLLEDALHVVKAGTLAPRKFGRSGFPIQKRLILGGRWMLAVGVGVIADGVFLECGDDVGAMAALESARFFADDLERCLNVLFGEESGQPFGDVIARRQNVVFGIEPEDDVDFSGSGPLGPSVRTSEDEHSN